MFSGLIMLLIGIVLLLGAAYAAAKTEREGTGIGAMMTIALAAMLGITLAVYGLIWMLSVN